MTDMPSGFARREFMRRDDAHAPVARGDQDQVGAAADDADLEGHDGAGVERQGSEALGEVAALAACLLGLGGVVLKVEPGRRQGLVDPAARAEAAAAEGSVVTRRAVAAVFFPPWPQRVRRARPVTPVGGGTGRGG